MTVEIEKWVDMNDQLCQLGRHSWSVSRLVQLAKCLPVMEVPLTHLCLNYKYENLRLREMAMHIKAIGDADLAYPIILDEDGELMDGRHRLMKALVLGLPTIKAVRFQKNPTPCRVSE